MRRLGLHRRRPSPRQLSVVLAVLGVVAGVAVLLVPVDAAFGDDPLLRLQPFSSTLGQAVTEVDCGSAVTSLGRRSDGPSLYGLARADACRTAATRRVATGVAAAAVIGLLGLISLAGAGLGRRWPDGR